MRSVDEGSWLTAVEKKKRGGTEDEQEQSRGGTEGDGT